MLTPCTKSIAGLAIPVSTGTPFIDKVALGSKAVAVTKVVLAAYGTAMVYTFVSELNVSTSVPELKTRFCKRASAAGKPLVTVKAYLSESDPSTATTSTVSVLVPTSRSNKVLSSPLNTFTPLTRITAFGSNASGLKPRRETALSTCWVYDFVLVVKVS